MGYSNYDLLQMRGIKSVAVPVPGLREHYQLVDENGKPFSRVSYSEEALKGIHPDFIGNVDDALKLLRPAETLVLTVTAGANGFVTQAKIGKVSGSVTDSVTGAIVSAFIKAYESEAKKLVNEAEAAAVITAEPKPEVPVQDK